jgi:hypothetical protein
MTREMPMNRRRYENMKMSRIIQFIPFFFVVVKEVHNHYMKERLIAFIEKYS